jgi:hypothetical protein
VRLYSGRRSAPWRGRIPSALSAVGDRSATQVVADHGVGDDFLAREVDLLLHLRALCDAGAVRSCTSSSLLISASRTCARSCFAVGGAAPTFWRTTASMRWRGNRWPLTVATGPVAGLAGGRGGRGLGGSLVGSAGRATGKPRQAQREGENSSFHAFLSWTAAIIRQFRRERGR